MLNAKSYYVGLNGNMTTGTQLPVGGQAVGSLKSSKITMTNDPVVDDQGYHLSFDVQGVKPADIAVVMSGNDVIIELEKEYDPSRVAHTNWDKAYGVFTRRMRMLADVDSVEYSISDDKLHIDMLRMGTIAVSGKKTTPVSQSPEATI